MKKLCRMIAVCLALVLLVGIVPIQKTEAADTKDLGYYYLAKGETVIFKTDAYKGKLSIVSKGGNTVKLSGKKIKVTAKKEGYIVFKAGKKKYSFRIIVGGNNPDKKVNYKEYDWDTTDGCTNYIEWIRSKVKGGKKLPDKRFCSWHIDESEGQRLITGDCISESGYSMFQISIRHGVIWDIGRIVKVSVMTVISVRCTMIKRVTAYFIRLFQERVWKRGKMK